LPFGSGNDFAQNIGLNRDFDSSVKVLQQNSITEIDAVENESGVFINTFGIGIDGLTNFYASNSKFKTGSLRYFFGGLKALMVSKPFEASIYIPELKVFIRRKIWMVVVANGKTEGGRYTISPSSNNYDGELEIVVVKSVPRLRILIEFLKLSFGFPFKKSIIESYKVTEECKIETAYKVRAHSDGEQIFGNKTYSFKLLTSSLPVVTDMKSR
ncbi:MAG TPA: hypothetical protein VFM80_08930, partial [Gracilimonas sp.]|uniref:diacylglycerol/lipid kinase family protein n=1 Tax=Gracilimonas sp. TaxID=1974203 RepID=UPI002DA987D8|nr:hypothetical protein [Gracilimonas sp.]